MNKESLIALIKKNDAKFVDLRFTDLRGKEQHITIPVSMVNDDLITHGKIIDGSSLNGWQKINHSDLILMPDLNTIIHDPFYQDSTIIIRCNVQDPHTLITYTRDPRSVALKAEQYLRESNIADSICIGPELEFFIFDDVRWNINMQGCFYRVDADEAHWNSGKKISGGNIGHRPGIKGGYLPVPPVDSSQDIRSAIALLLESLGIIVEAHHHEVATGNQCEIITRFESLTKKADHMQLIKYVIHNVVHNYGKTATFMPKPLVGDNGCGMHCHISMLKSGQNVFAGDQYAGLSKLGVFFIGGIIKHARALNAITNPTINSYRRLVPGFEAPILLAYSACNRSAAIRIPHSSRDSGRRIEVRFPDPMANPYLAFAALLMAGIDGIKNAIHPGLAIDKDLYELPLSQLNDIPMVALSLEHALQDLEQDHDFLVAGDVFTADLLTSYIELLKSDVEKLRSLVHPFEFEMYYSL